jgi:hypothetical protein
LIPINLENAHPELRAIDRIVSEHGRGYRYYDWGRYGNIPIVPLSVSQKGVGRALRFLEALIRGLAQRGLGLVRHRLSSELGFGSGADSISFRLTEHLARRRGDSEPRGERLVFQVDAHGLDQAERSWSDGKREKLEEKLGEIAVWIIAGVLGVRERRLQLEAEKSVNAEREAKRQEALRLEALEEGYRQLLAKSAEAWRHAGLIRAFVDACERELRGTAGAVLTDGPEINWLVWAKSCADCLDPLKGDYLREHVKRFRTGSPGC